MEETVKQSLDEMHDKLFVLMQETDRICRKNGIKYFLRAGTLLGALRYGDYIPWDDDADILMLRKDYIKFKKVFPAVAGEGYVLDKPEDRAEYDDYIPRIRDAAHPVSFGKESADPILDIFIMDRPAQFYTLQRLGLKLIIALSVGHRSGKTDSSHFKTIPEKIGALFLPALGRLIPYRFLAAAYEKLSRGKSEKCADKVFLSNEVLKYWNKVIFYDKDDFSGRNSIKLRDAEFMVSDRPEDEMIALYGPDYLTPPPVSEQLPEHLGR